MRIRIHSPGKNDRYSNEDPAKLCQYGSLESNFGTMIWIQRILICCRRGRTPLNTISYFKIFFYLNKVSIIRHHVILETAESLLKVIRPHVTHGTVQPPLIVWVGSPHITIIILIIEDKALLSHCSCRRKRCKRLSSCYPFQMCHEIFDQLFFSWFEPIPAFHYQVKLFLNSFTISQAYRIR